MSRFKLNASTAALVTNDTPDQIGRAARLTLIVQPPSPELVKGNARYTLKAAPGCFVQTTTDGDRVVHDGTAGIIIYPLVCEHYFLEWPASREEVGPPLSKTYVRPPKALVDWRTPEEHGVAKEGLQVLAGPNKGNRVVETWAIHGVVGGHETEFRFSGMATTTGRDMAKRAAFASVVMEGPDGKDRRVYGAPLTRFRITTERRTGPLGTYYLPVVEYLGRLGEAAGPTFEQWQALQERRLALQAELVAAGMPLLAMHVPEQAALTKHAPREDDGSNLPSTVAPLPLARDWTPPAPPEPANDQYDERSPPLADEHDYAGQPEPWNGDVPF